MYLKNSFADNFGQLPTLKAPFPISLRDLTIFSCKLGFNVPTVIASFLLLNMRCAFTRTYVAKDFLCVFHRLMIIPRLPCSLGSSEETSQLLATALEKRRWRLVGPKKHVALLTEDVKLMSKLV